MIVVGAYARVVDEAAVRPILDAIEGVDCFDVDSPGVLGLLVETEAADHADQLLRGTIRQVDGVLGVWTVSVEHDAAGDARTANPNA